MTFIQHRINVYSTSWYCIAVNATCTNVMWKLLLPYLSEVLDQKGLSKQCRPRPDALNRGVWPGSILFATNPAILDASTCNKMKYKITSNRLSSILSLAESCFQLNEYIWCSSACARLPVNINFCDVASNDSDASGVDHYCHSYQGKR